MTFPRHHRFRRAEKFAPMELTARDAEILRAVNRHRFLRSHQIADLVGGSRQQVLRRLQLLYHHGYLERPRCQIDYYHAGGSRCIANGLASRGAAFLRRVDDIPFSRLDWSSRNRAVKRLFLEHALMVSDIMVALEMACRKRSDVRLLMEDEIPLPESTRALGDPFRWTVKVSGKRKLAVIPDRVFALEFTDNNERILCFLEADRGTMPVVRASDKGSSLAKKVQAYAATWRQQIHRHRFGVSRIRVLPVIIQDQRAAALRTVLMREVPSLGIFLIGKWAQARDASTVLGDCWLTANDGAPVSLLS